MKKPLKECANYKNKNKYRQTDSEEAYRFLFAGDDGEELPRFLECYGFKYVEVDWIRRKARELIENKQQLRTDIFNGVSNYNRKAA